jgi:hypothetical protein
MRDGREGKKRGGGCRDQVALHEFLLVVRRDRQAAVHTANTLSVADWIQEIALRSVRA